MLLPLSYNANRERTVSVDSLVNLQPEVTFGGRQPVALVTCPGLKQFSMATNPGIGRGIIESRGILYAVIGSYLYKFTSAGVASVLGNVYGAGLVGMSTSGTEIHIATGGSGYICNTNTETVTTIIDPDYPAGTTSAFINGRFVTDDPTPGLLGRVYYSGLLDGADWDALDFDTSERKSDDAEAVWALGESLVIFGTRSVEFWQGVADGYLPVPGALLPFGLLAKRSVAETSGTLFFLDSDGQVRQMQGYQSSVVSTPAVQFALTEDSTAEGCAYVYEGRTIYEISSGSVTLAYDATSSAQLGRPIWFKRQTADGRHKQRGAVYCYGKILSLGYDDGKVYELSRDVIPDVREFTVSIPVDDDTRAWRSLDEIELVGRTGTGAIPDTDPQVMLRLSRNNGYVEGEEKWVGLGTVGDYAKRIRWRRLGRFLQMSMTFRQTDQYDWTVLGVRLRGR